MAKKYSDDFEVLYTDSVRTGEAISKDIWEKSYNGVVTYEEYINFLPKLHEIEVERQMEYASYASRS